MSYSKLQQLQGELRRIYAAGSVAAAHDDRLRMLLPKLRQWGKRSSVIAKLEEEVRMLVEQHSEDERSAERLQRLTSQLYSILRVMGDTEPAGDTGALKTIGGHECGGDQHAHLSTPLTCRELEVAMSAFTSTGKKRIDRLYEAKQSGLFCDLRLLKPALALLDDPKAAEYAALFVLPSFGRAVLPYVEDGFHMKGKKRDANKLAVIAAVRDEEVDDLVLQCANKGSLAVRLAAIRSMMGKVRFQQELIVLTSASNKRIREEAYYALAECPSEPAMQHMLAAFQTDDHATVRSVAYTHENPLLDETILQAMYGLVNSARERLGDKEKSEQGRVLLNRYLLAMRNKRLEGLSQFFLQVSSEVRLFYELDWLKMIYYEALIYLRKMGSRQELELIYELEKMGHIKDTVPMAAGLLSPAEFYERYYHAITTKWSTLPEKHFEMWKMSFRLAVRQLMREQTKAYLEPVDVADHARWVEMKSQVPFRERWDDRWLDWAIEEDDPIIVSNLARPDHEPSRTYMENELLMEKEHKMVVSTVEHLLLGMRRAGMDSERKWEAMMRAIEHPENDTYHFFTNGFLEVHAIDLPPAFKPRVEAVLAGELGRYGSIRRQLGLILARMDESAR